MSEALTLVVTENNDLASKTQSLLSERSLNVVALPSIAEVQDYDLSQRISCLVFDIPDDINDFERSLRKLKRDAAIKYVPCVGILPQKSQNQSVTRQLFFHVIHAEAIENTLPHTIESAYSDFRRYEELINEVNSRTSAIGLINSGTFRLRTLQQAEALTTMLSMACPEPAAIALGLSELLLNAIEHGNLGISYEEKTHLLESGTWEHEINSRLAMPEFCNKFVEVQFLREPGAIAFIVTDQGKGFDWRKFTEVTPEASTSKHGRGIAVALAMGFDKLSYNDVGNQVSAVIKLKK